MPAARGSLPTRGGSERRVARSRPAGGIAPGHAEQRAVAKTHEGVRYERHRITRRDPRLAPQAAIFAVLRAGGPNRQGVRDVDRARRDPPAWSSAAEEEHPATEEATAAWARDQPPFPIVRHGYEPAAVDDYITELERKLETLRRVPRTNGSSPQRSTGSASRQPGFSASRMTRPKR